MKEESHLKYIVALGTALILAVAVWWQLSDLLCPPRGCRPRRDFLVNFFLVWMPSVITFMLTGGFIMMIWEKFERRTTDMDSSQPAPAAAAPANDAIAQARAAYDRGCASMQGGDPQGAIREFDLAISLDPTDNYAFIARGNAYADLQQFERAIADHDHAIALDPASPPAYYNRGRTWQDVGDLDRALADLDAAIRLRPAYLTALHARGIALQALGDRDHAIADFRQALALANDDTTRQQLQSKLAALGANP